MMMKDYSASRSYDLVSGTNELINLPTSNVLQFFTADGSKITVRPSGTEPKIKFYFSVVETVEKKKEVAEISARLDQRIEALKRDLQ